MTEPQNTSSYEERILAAAIRLAEAADDPNKSSEAVSEIVLCARGMLRRKPPDPADNIERRRRRITISEVPIEFVEVKLGVANPDASAESRVEYDEDPED